MSPNLVLRMRVNFSWVSGRVARSARSFHVVFRSYPSVRETNISFHPGVLYSCLPSRLSSAKLFFVVFACTRRWDGSNPISASPAFAAQPFQTFSHSVSRMKIRIPQIKLQGPGK